MNKNQSIKKRVFIISLIFIISLALIFTIINKAKIISSDNTEYTKTLTIKTQKLTNSINVAGNIKSKDTYIVTGETDLRIKSVNVNIGDKIKKGDVICIYDDAELIKEYNCLQSSLDLKNEARQSAHNINQRNLDSAKAEREILLSEAQQNIDDTIVARDNAYLKYNDLKTQCDNKCTEKDILYSLLATIEDELQYNIENQKYQELLQEIQKIETEIATIESQLSSYDTNVKSMQSAYFAVDRSTNSNIQNIQDAINNEKFDSNSDVLQQLDEIKEKIKSCKITSPQDGIVTSLNILEGCRSSDEILATIENDENLIVEIQIKDADILSIKKGMKAIVKTDATGEQEFYGIVSKIVAVLSSNNTSSNESNYSAEIILEEKYSELILGMKAKVKIISDERNDVIAVPYDSITHNTNGQSIVFLARKEANDKYIAKAVNVEIGLVSDYYTEIIADDIKSDDLLIVDIENIYDGKEIYINLEATNG